MHPQNIEAGSAQASNVARAYEAAMQARKNIGDSASNMGDTINAHIQQERDNSFKDRQLNAQEAMSEAQIQKLNAERRDLDIIHNITEDSLRKQGETQAADYIKNAMAQNENTHIKPTKDSSDYATGAAVIGGAIKKGYDKILNTKAGGKLKQWANTIKQNIQADKGIYNIHKELQDTNPYEEGRKLQQNYENKQNYEAIGKKAQQSLTNPSVFGDSKKQGANQTLSASIDYANGANIIPQSLQFPNTPFNRI